MSYMQCPDCKLTAPALATYLRGDECPRCATSMLPRKRIRDVAPVADVAEQPAAPA